ncbi:hypoxanthine phosphoribosyltransferase [Angustibacter sp. McL0619]|uniref:hypoxanthine phosphoribosyltransferase n=1 Tax=Angustibacter sp. McL0619 TaxID=3415676 RepID=UPI003CF2C1AE
MSGPDRAVAEVRAAVRHALADLDDDGLVLVAVSGGADSLALAAATAFVAPRQRLRAGAVLVDHGLQDGSADVVERAAASCRELGLDPVRTVRVDVPDDGTGPEAAARRARYEALEKAAAELGAATVLLGHTRDDQAETVLLGLARGSGTRSLSGMAARRGLLRRPLIELPRTTTKRVCEVLELRPWSDPHNDDDRFARVRARRLLPELESALGPGTVAALARSAALARDDSDLLDELAGRALAELTATPAPGGRDAQTGEKGLDVEALAELPPAVRRRVLRQAALAAGASDGQLSSRHVAAMDSLVTAWRGQGPVALPGKVGAVRRCGRLLLVDHSDMGDDLASVMLTEEQIQTRLRELAEQIDADYAGQDLLLVGVLKGAVMVMADLARALHHPAEMDWMAVSSYGSGTKSSGVVRIMKDLDRDITGRNVLIVEDIVDSGLTLSWLQANLRSRGPASVNICTLLRKPTAAKVEVEVRYVGFDIDPEFVVGYGLDYAEKYRNLPFVGTLAPHVYS